MYLYKIRKSPAEGGNFTLTTSQMIVVIFLFMLFFVAPVIGFSKLENSKPRVAGISTTSYEHNKPQNNIALIYNFSRMGALLSTILLITSVGIAANSIYKKYRTFEL